MISIHANQDYSTIIRVLPTHANILSLIDLSSYEKLIKIVQSKAEKLIS
jgi:hypothetical protein